MPETAPGLAAAYEDPSHQHRQEKAGDPRSGVRWTWLGATTTLGNDKHVPGVTNVAADALSRLLDPQLLPFPFLGAAVQDQCPILNDGFWRVV